VTNNPWTVLVDLGPEKIEELFDRMYAQYGQAFKPVAVDNVRREILLELKDGRRVRESL
jgi:hypothetical protein